MHIETNFFPWNSFVPALTGSYNYPPIAGAPPAYSLDLAADGASWVSLVFTSDANGNFAGVESVVVSATACVAGATSTRTATSSAAPSSMPSSSAAPSPTLSTLPTPQGTTASLVMCGAGGATTAGVASPYDLYFGDVVRVSSQSASTYASPSNCVLTFRGAPGTGCGLNLKIFAYQLEDEIDGKGLESVAFERHRNRRRKRRVPEAALGTDDAGLCLPPSLFECSLPLDSHLL